jgi:hypothetical protein
MTSKSYERKKDMVSKSVELSSNGGCCKGQQWGMCGCTGVSAEFVNGPFLGRGWEMY